MRGLKAIELRNRLRGIIGYFARKVQDTDNEGKMFLNDLRGIEKALDKEAFDMRESLYVPCPMSNDGITRNMKTTEND